MNGRILILLSLATLLPACMEETKTDEAGSTLVIPAAAQDTSSGDSSDTSGQELFNQRSQTLSVMYEDGWVPETDIEPKPTSTEIEVLQQVIELINQGQPEQAIALLEANRDDVTSSAALDFMLGSLYQQHATDNPARIDAAAQLYRVAVAKHSKFRRAWWALGMIYVQQSKWEQVIPVLTKVIDLGKEDAITWGFLGFAYTSTGNHVSAESCYRNAIIFEPDRLDWQQSLAGSFFYQGRYAEAVALLDTMIEKHPTKINLWDTQAQALLLKGDTARAAENYEFIDRMGKANVEQLNKLGDIYTNQELYDLAISAYTRALKMDPAAQPDRAILACQILTGRGELDLARQLIAELQKLRGDSLNDKQRLGLLRMQSRIALAEGAGEREAEVLREIIEIEPLDGQALILLGQYEVRNENPEQAIYYFERAAAIEKYEADANVRHAQLLVKQKKYNEALVKLRRAQQIQPRENIQKYLEGIERAAAKSARS